jgi:hypothetical protein
MARNPAPHTPEAIGGGVPVEVGPEIADAELAEFERREAEVIEGRVYAPTLAEVMAKALAHGSG